MTLIYSYMHIYICNICYLYTNSGKFLEGDIVYLLYQISYRNVSIISWYTLFMLVFVCKKLV